MSNTLKQWMTVQTAAVLAACAMFHSAGCSSDDYVEVPTTTGVKGTVKLNGQPVTTGHVSFVPANEPAPDAEMKQKGGGLRQAELDSSGAFSLSEEIAIGKYKVVVSPLPLTPTDPNIDLNQLKASVPQKYQSADTTDLTADVQSGGGEFNFELKK